MSAVLCGYIWLNNDYDKEVRQAVIFTNTIFIIFALLLCFAGLYLPSDLYNVIKPVQIPVAAVFLICSLCRNKLGAFISYVVLISFLSGIMIPKLFNIWYGFGQNELMSYAKYAKENNLSLGAYNLWERFRLQYYYDGDVEYFQNGSAYGAKYVKTTIYNNSFNNDVVVIKNKKLNEINIKYKIIQSGKKYSLIEECQE